MRKRNRATASNDQPRDARRARRPFDENPQGGMYGRGHNFFAGELARRRKNCYLTDFAPGTRRVQQNLLSFSERVAVAGELCFLATGVVQQPLNREPVLLVHQPSAAQKRISTGALVKEEMVATASLK